MRIEIVDVSFRNFLSYGNSPTKLVLTNGLNLVKGSAQAGTRANRVGKTGLLSSISYALYGKEPRGLTQNEVINWQNRKNCELMVNFKRGETLYTVKRGLKPNFLTVYENNKELPSLPHITDTQSQIEEILGIGYKVFSNLVFSNVNFSEPILKMKTPSRRKFIEEIFDIEVFSRLNEACVKKLNLISQRIGESRSEISLKNGLIEEIKNQMKKIKKFDEDEYQNLIKKFEKYDIGTIHQAIDLLEEEISIFQNKRDKLVNYIAKIGSKINYLVKVINDLKKTIDAAKEYKQNLDELSSIKTNVKELNNTIKDNNNQIELLKEKIKKVEDRILHNTSILSGLSVELTNINKQLDDLDKDICPTCGQELKDSKIISNLKKRKKEILGEQKKYNNIAELEKEKNENTEKIKTIRENNQNHRNLISKIEKLETAIKNAVHLDVDVEDKIKKYQIVIKKQKILVDKIDDERLTLEKENDARNSQLRSLRESVIKYNNIENKLEILKQERKLYHDSKEEIEKKEKRIVELQKEIDVVMTTKIEKLESLFTYFTTLKDMCKDDRVKQEAIASIMPLLAEKTNEYLSTVGFEFYVQLDSWLEATFRGPGIPGCGYNALSGGESKSVDVSLQMAFHDICRLKARNLIDIMVLDELLDTSVDTYGMKKILDIVKNKQEQDNLKVYIISHRVINEEEFDKVLVVEKQRGFSIVREK